MVWAKLGYRLYRLQLGAVSLLLWLANSSGGLADHVHLSPASVTLQAAYAGDPLRASAGLSNPDTYREGINTYRWIVNGAPVAQGVVPQSLLLPLDGDLHGTNGQAPSHSQGLSFVAGLFGKSLAGLPGQAIQMSRAADSRLAYPAANTVSPREGSIEMWVKLAHDLDTHGATYDDRPRLFSYMVDSTHTLFVDVNEGRVVVTSINGGQYHSTWPTPPHWRAGEWHYVAATWSADANILALYYDGAMVDDDTFVALPGAAQTWHLGSGAEGNVMDATFDDVRLSRRALSSFEIAAAATRGKPAPHNEMVLATAGLAVGDLVTLEFTPCDVQGACEDTVIASTTLGASPLGPLSPAPGLLASGTSWLTLGLTTTVAADCRWSEEPYTPYGSMPNSFDEGQGGLVHRARVSGLHDLAERRFHVRCRDRDGERDPDLLERETHVRVLGSWDGGYPRIASMYDSDLSERGASYAAGYDLLVPYGLRDAGHIADAVRNINPDAKLLLFQNVTYGWPEGDALTASWWDSQPGDPGYNCLLRDSAGQVLLSEGWGHPMYNLTVATCRAALARQSVDNLLSRRSDQGDDLAYDGIWWDGLASTISWLGSDIDSNLDGAPDNPTTLDEAYREGIKDLVARIRSSLPHAVLVGNGAAHEYAPWLNGRLYETELRAILDGAPSTSWEAVVADYRAWMSEGQAPHTTFLCSGPELLYDEKYPFPYLGDAPAAMQAEAAASYQRMRYGLASALMGDGLFVYELGSVSNRSWWYDEFGAPGGDGASANPGVGGALPAPGYLGQPTGDPTLLAGAPGVWTRSFQNGLVVLNTTRSVRMANLPATYCKLRGSQAPLFQKRVDDDEATASSGWQAQAANESQFGATVHTAQAGSGAQITYKPSLAYGGAYQVLAWVAPQAGQTRAASVAVHHAGGETVVSLDQSTGEIGWRILGTFNLNAGATGYATLAATGNGTVVADAFKWVSIARYNDGSPIDSIVLQPQDGAVLLSACTPNELAFLPMVVREAADGQVTR